MRNTHDCCIKFDFVLYALISHMRNIGMKSVTNVYQFFTRCEELFTNTSSVKCTKCNSQRTLVRAKDAYAQSGLRHCCSHEAESHCFLAKRHM